MLARNWIYLFCGNILGQGFFLLGMLHLARTVGPAGFGLWNFSQAWMLYLLQAEQIGLEVVAIRSIARSPELTGKYIRTVIGVRGSLTVVLLALTGAACVLHLVPAEMERLLLIFSLTLIPTAFLLEWVFEAYQEIAYVSIARFLKGALFAALVFLFVHAQADLEASAGYYVLSVTVPALLVFIWVGSRHGFKGTFDVRHGLQTLREALPLGLASLLSQFCLFAGILYAGVAASHEDLGYFTAAHRPVVFLWAYVVSSSHRILLPSLSSRFRSALPEFQLFIEKFFRLSVLAALPLGLAVTVVAPVLIPVLYTSEYARSILVFQILFWFLIVGLMRFIFEIGLIAADCQRRYFFSMVGLAALYAVLTPVLTHAFGIVGTAVAAVVAETALMVYLLVSFPFTNLFSLVKNVWKPGLAFVGGAVTAWAARAVPVAGQLGLCLGVYLVILLLTRGFTLKDWGLLWSVLRPSEPESAS